MHQGADTPSQPEPITAQTDHGWAQFRRTSPTRATLEIEYDVPGLRADLNRDAIQAACADEIARMRAALHGLAEALTRQLSLHGRRPRVQRAWEDAEERHWRVEENALHIHPITTRTTEELRGYEGVADALLVQETVRLLSVQREESIREIYRKVFAEVTGELTPEKTERNSPPTPGDRSGVQGNLHAK